MGSHKFTKYDSSLKVEERPWKVHPIWRGLGCILYILIPIISFLGAYLLVQAGFITSLLASLNFVSPPEFETLVFSFVFLGTTYDVTWMTLIIAGLLILIGFAALMVLYSIMYSVLGPSRYGPLDAKPGHFRKKHKTTIKR